MKYIIIIMALQFFNLCCKTPKNIIREIIDLQWKNKASEAIAKKYSNYMGNRKIDTLNNYAADISYKISDINRYPFGQGIKLLQNEILKNKIRFDSIICVSTQSTGLNPETLNSDIYYIFFNGHLVKAYSHDYLNNDINSIDPYDFDLDSEFARLNSKKDGNSASLLIFTKFKNDWSFEIGKIVINNHDVW